MSSEVVSPGWEEGAVVGVEVPSADVAFSGLWDASSVGLLSSTAMLMNIGWFLAGFWLSVTSGTVLLDLAV